MSHHLHRYLLWVGLSCAGALASAQDAAPRLYIGGSQGSSAGTYTYAGQIVPLEGARVGQGWFQKTVASWLTYQYDTTVAGAPTEAKAGAAGIEGGWGYAWDTERFKGDASLSLGLRHTQLRPAAARADGQHGTRVTLTPQIGARYLFTPRWDADVLASYSAGTHSSFGRARMGVRPGDTEWRLGLEATLSQGKDYRTQQTGVFAGRNLGTGWFLEVNAGQARPRDGKSTPYVGLSASLVR
ncbi:MAG TPA: cellulose biosynthesis protein BcsS [Acidovorax sp.]|nr:cellulose biosynthesis protein BcsS [Acidovorax sp.]